MNRKARFKKLLEPFRIRDVELRNRIVKAGAVVNYVSEECYVTERLKDYYEALARGGVGMIVTGGAPVDYPLGIGRRTVVGVFDDKFILGLSEWTQVVHRHGCRIFLQLSHAGPGHPKSMFGLQPVAASSLTKNESPCPQYDVARELTTAEIEGLVDKFTAAAARAQKAGFDGVELQQAHNYLGNSFLSLAWNKRQDIYGCQNLESRTRFVVTIIRAIKEHLGQDYPVGVKINGVEWGVENGLTSEETQKIAQILEEAGADYICVSGYGYRDFGRALFPEQILYPELTKEAESLARTIKKPGMFVPVAQAIKKVVSIPVIAVGHLNPKLGEWVLRKGKADLIAFARLLQADAELPNELASGRLDDIAPCTSCFTCVNCVAAGEPVRCRINAAMGNERKYAIKPAKTRKNVMVIGGGPAGMEAARVAALRGHEVLLYERKHKLGGVLDLAAVTNGLEIENLPALGHYLKTQIIKLGVKVRLGKEISLDLVEAIKPDVVILAIGGMMPTVPEVPGINRPNVITTSGLHHKVNFLLRFLGPRFLRWLTKFYLPVGKRVIIMGGLIYGCEIAKFLVERGREITIVEESDQLGTGIIEFHRVLLLDWLAKKGTTMLSSVRYEEVTDKGLTLITQKGQKRSIEADTILIAMPPKPNTKLFQALKEKVKEVYLIGDAKEREGRPCLIIDAIHDGHHTGCAI